MCNDTDIVSKEALKETKNFKGWLGGWGGQIMEDSNKNHHAPYKSHGLC